MNAANFTPKQLEDFIGPGRRALAMLQAKVERERTGGEPITILLQGPPGTGKTRIAQIIARLLAGHELAVDEVNGKEVGIETVREWRRTAGYCSLWGDWSVKIVNEIDECSADAMSLLLTYLDKLPPKRAVIGTCNMSLKELQERFQTRFQFVKVPNATTEEVAEFLTGRWKLPQVVATAIAIKSAGNVRAALKMAQDWIDSSQMAA